MHFEHDTRASALLFRTHLVHADMGFVLAAEVAALQAGHCRQTTFFLAGGSVSGVNAFLPGSLAVNKALFDNTKVLCPEIISMRGTV